MRPDISGQTRVRVKSLPESNQWRNYGLGPGEPGGPQPQWAKWGPPGSG